MTSPVYRHLDTKPTVMGLVFPEEWFLVITPLVLSFFVSQPLVGAGLCFVLYVVIRVGTHGKAPGHLYHWVLFKIRQVRSGGRFTAAARAPQPRFRLIPYAMDPRWEALEAKARVLLDGARKDGKS